MKLTFTIALDTERDAELVAYLDAQDNRSAAIRDALRLALDQGRRPAATIDDVLAAVQALQRGGGVLHSEQAGSEGEPPDIAAALDNLGVA